MIQPTLNRDGRVRPGKLGRFHLLVEILAE